MTIHFSHRTRSLTVGTLTMVGSLPEPPAFTSCWKSQKTSSTHWRAVCRLCIGTQHQSKL